MAFEKPKKNPALALLSRPCCDIIATSKLVCHGLILMSRHCLIMTEFLCCVDVATLHLQF